jgi:hypothetical protein
MVSLEPAAAQRFDTTRGVERIICEIEPAYEIVRLRWERADCEIVRLELNLVHDLTVEMTDGRESLTGTFRDSVIDPFRLQLRPSVHLSWGTSAYP